MRITTGLSNTNIYTNLTKHGYIMLQFVNGNDFQNAPRVFFSPEEVERFISVIDLFLNKRQISNPVNITSNANGNSMSVITKDEQLLIILTLQNVGNTNIPLTRLQATALRRFLANWPVYGTLQELINSANRRQGKTYQQGNYNNPPNQQSYPQQYPNNPYPQQQYTEPPTGMQANPTMTQNMNTMPQQVNNQPTPQQNNSVPQAQQQQIPGQQVNNTMQQPNNPKDILSELDELIG